jgi:hypothetical protein
VTHEFVRLLAAMVTTEIVGLLAVLALLRLWGDIAEAREDAAVLAYAAAVEAEHERLVEIHRRLAEIGRGVGRLRDQRTS